MQLLAQGGFIASSCKLAVFRQGAYQLAINFRVGGQAFVLVQKVRLTREIANQSPGFGHQQRASGHIPGLQAGFKKAIAVASGYIGQAQCCGTRHTHTRALGHHLALHF